MKKQINTLTGIRAFAAFWVVIHHGIPQILNQNGLSNVPVFIQKIAENGWLGVDFFFLLSGFIMGYVHGEEFKTKFNFSDFKNFIKLRLIRIYPVHFVCLMGLLFISLVSNYLLHIPLPGDNFTMSKFFYSFFLLNGLGLPDSIGWNVPTWSLSTELFAYFFFPIGAFLIGNKLNSAFKAFLGIITIIIFQQLLARSIDPSLGFYLNSEFVTLRILPEFFIGYLLFHIHLKAKMNNMLNDFLATIVFAIVLILCQLPITNPYAFVFEIAFILILFLLSINQGFVKRIFDSKILILLGKTSFSLYIVHSITILFFRFLALKKPNFDMAFFIIYLFVTYAASWVLYTKIEEKSRKFLVKKLGIIRK